MVSERSPKRGEVWWAVVDKKRPVVVVQADFLNKSSMDWILAVPLTTKLHRAELPGNVRLTRANTGLPRASVANVAQFAPLHRAGFRERVHTLARKHMASIDEGLRLVLAL